ncbi:hypothetical protein M1N24_03050, partial [Dehalococcoidia bacterium]|nr:hypothetical protein [Dehalococcoidia bacterium]
RTLSPFSIGYHKVAHKWNLCLMVSMGLTVLLKAIFEGIMHPIGLGCRGIARVEYSEVITPAH